jgi:hypothetical protein
MSVDSTDSHILLIIKVTVPGNAVKVLTVSSTIANAMSMKLERLLKPQTSMARECYLAFSLSSTLTVTSCDAM